MLICFRSYWGFDCYVCIVGFTFVCIFVVFLEIITSFIIVRDFPAYFSHWLIACRAIHISHYSMSEGYRFSVPSFACEIFIAERIRVAFRDPVAGISLQLKFTLLCSFVKICKHIFTSLAPPNPSFALLTLRRFEVHHYKPH